MMSPPLFAFPQRHIWFKAFPPYPVQSAYLTFSLFDFVHFFRVSTPFYADACWDLK